MSINFTLNNGNTITLGKKSNYIEVIIHDDTEMETPTTLLITYTADLFQKAGLTRKPTFDEYNAMPRAVCQSDVLSTNHGMKKSENTPHNPSSSPPVSRPGFSISKTLKVAFKRVKQYNK